MSFEIEIQRRFSEGMLKVPPRVMRALAGSPVCSPEGFVLDPQVQLIVRLSDKLGHGDWSHQGVRRARRSMEVSSQVLQARPRGGIAVHDEVARVAGGVIRLRVYRPTEATGTLPVIVFYHGGGFVLG